MNKNKIIYFSIFTIILFFSVYSLFSSDYRIEELNRHFENSNYEQSIIIANKIIKDRKTKKEDKTKAYIIKGISEFSTNQILNTRITFLDLLLFDQEVSLDSNKVSPKIIIYFNELKQKLANQNNYNVLNSTKL